MVLPGPPELDRAVDLTSAGFMKPLTPELQSDVEQHLTGDITYTIMEEEVPVGFATLSSIDVELPDGDRRQVLYLHGIMVDPSYQGKGIAGKVFERALTEDVFHYLSFRTQSAIMYASAERCFGSIYPSRHGDRIPAHVESVGVQVAQAMGYEFPLHQRAYGGPLYGEKPMHHDPDFQAGFDSICPNFESGDAVVCVAPLDQ